MSIASRLLPLGAVAFALVATPAAADSAAPPGAVVASTPHGTLSAADDGTEFSDDQLVVTLRGTDADQKPYATSDSFDTPLWPGETLSVDHVIFTSDDGPEVVVAAGAVSADVATVELRYGDAVLRMPTAAGAGYHGKHADEVRFYAGELALSDDQIGDPGGMRMFDASGTLLAQRDVTDEDTDVTLLRRRAGGLPLQFVATLNTHEAPLPLDGGHLEQELCLSARAGSGEQEAVAYHVTCQDRLAELQTMRLGGLRGCGSAPSTLTGFVPADTSELAVVLGSGRRVRYPTRTTPFGRPERIVTAVMPRGEAIRTASALDASGHVLVRGEVEVAPPDRRCDISSDRVWSFLSVQPPAHFGDPPGTQVAAGGPGAPKLLVRESGDLVCVGLDALALDGSDCSDPPLDSRHPFLMSKRYPDGRTAVAVMVAAKVTAMNLLLAGGARVLVPATESATYTGRLHSALHFAFAVLAPGQDPMDGDLLDAAGRRVGTASGDHCSCQDERPLRTVLSGRLARAHYRVTARGIKDHTGITLAVAPRQPTQCDEYSSTGAAVDGFVSCATRVTAIYGLVRQHVRRIEVQLTSHRHVDAAVRVYGGNRVFLALLPRRAAVRAVRLVGVKGKDTVTMPLLAPARQCGYTFNGSP